MPIASVSTTVSAKPGDRETCRADCLSALTASVLAPVAQPPVHS
jgi:hypothetical protein